MFRQAVFNRASWTCALFVRRLASTPVLPIAAAVPSVDSDLAIADEAIPITAYFSHAFEAQHCQNCWPSRIRTEDYVIHSHRVLLSGIGGVGSDPTLLPVYYRQREPTYRRRPF